MGNNLPIEQMTKSADAIRALAIDAVAKANSGHTGTAMALADAAVVLLTQHLKYNPRKPHWADRDRFVLSVGHASMLLYSMLHLTGYDVSMDDIRNFRQWGSITPGHPEVHITPGVETTTGPLGQGISTAVGMALAEAHLAKTFNQDGFNIVDHHTWVFAGDGDLMEGVSHEAAALAAHWGLGKLIVLYDNNRITIDGGTDISMSEDAAARFEAYGWHVQRIDAGHDMEVLDAAFTVAKSVSDQPSFISVRTEIGRFHPKVNTSKAHGALTDPEENKIAKANFGWEEEEFSVPAEVYAFMQGAAEEAAAAATKWVETFEAYANTHPHLAAQFARAMKNELPDGWENTLPTFGTDVRQATRAASGKVLESLIPAVPTLLGGSADLTGSNKTLVKGMGSVHEDAGNRYVYYGVREHGMGAILNGLSLHGGIRPYGGTFLVFSDYMRGAVRLAALQEQPVIFVYSHDSIGLGEDGPTHQPIEHLAALRAMPNLTVFRPADGNETALGWKVALENKHGPTALILTRQKLSTIAHSTNGAVKGGYVLSDDENAQAIIIATGSEVEIALDAQILLREQGIATRVVSMPSTEMFDTQDAEYRNTVLPPHITARVSLEAGSTFGWGRYVGTFGKSIGIDRFGASAPYQTIYEQLGITAENVVATVQSLLN